MPKQKKMWDNILTVIMSVLCLLWIYPIVLILLNSLKIEGTFTTSTVFKLPTAETFAGLSNYVYGVTKMGFLSSLGYSLVITVTSVALILLCCSMTGWYLTRVNNKLSKFMNLLIVFSYIDPCFLTLCDSLPQSHIQNVLYLEKKGKPLFNYPFKRVNIRIYVSKCNLSLEEESKNKRQTSATSSRRP